MGLTISCSETTVGEGKRLELSSRLLTGCDGCFDVLYEFDFGNVFGRLGTGGMSSRRHLDHRQMAD